MVTHEVIFGLLRSLCSERRERALSDASVAVIAAVMRYGGAFLRSSDAGAMLDFVIDVHRCVGEARGGGGGGAALNAAKTDLMLSLVQDVKNNKSRNRAPISGALSNATCTWVRRLEVRTKASLQGVTWELLLRRDKRGMWWVPGAARADGGQQQRPDRVGAAADAAAGDDALLSLAAEQRFVGVQRSIFCAVMGSQDFIDAFERLCRLGLRGAHERELVRVVVELCLRERAYNPFYALLLERVCSGGRQMKFTLQLVFWDHLKEMGAGMPARRVSNLGRLAASMAAHGAVGLNVLKPLEGHLSGRGGGGGGGGGGQGQPAGQCSPAPKRRAA